MDAEAGVARVSVLRAFPIVDAPMDERRTEENDSQFFVARNGAGFVVESPAKDLTGGFFNQITLSGLRGLVEDPIVPQRTAKLDVLGVRPYERTSGAARLATEEFERGDIVGIPDLLGQQTAVTAGAVFHHCK